MRGRVGVTATDRVLLYVTGGFAALPMDFRQSFSEPPFTTPPDGTPQVATFSRPKPDGRLALAWKLACGATCRSKRSISTPSSMGRRSGSFTGGVGVPRGATLANWVNDIHFQVARVGLDYGFVGP